MVDLQCGAGPHCRSGVAPYRYPQGRLGRPRARGAAPVPAKPQRAAQTEVAGASGQQETSTQKRSSQKGVGRVEGDAWSDLMGSLPSGIQLFHISLRLFVALVVGGLVGLQRELTHKPAGLRTHMLLSLGSALILVTAEQAGMSKSDLSRVVQGL